MVESQEPDFANLWATAWEAWFPENLHRLYLRPRDNDVLDLVAFPVPLQGLHLFALTAYNPRGVLLAKDENELRNKQLRADIIDTSVRFMPSAGFNIEGHIEHGFMFLATTGELTKVKEIALDLATKWQQGAIYEYIPMNEFAFKRLTLPVVLTNVEAAVVVVQATQKEAAICDQVLSNPK